MNSLAFPKMFQGNSTLILKDKDATKTCVHLLVSSESGDMFGDPDFGIKLRKYTFDQNNYILKDIIIDEIYSKLTIFCPQIFLERKNITLTSEGSKLYCTVTCRSKLDFTINTFNLVLLDEEN